MKVFQKILMFLLPSKKRAFEQAINAETAEAFVLGIVNFALDALIGAEPGWHLMHGKSWSIYKPEYLIKQAAVRTLGSPPGLTMKAAAHVNEALKDADAYISGPTHTSSDCYYWSVLLPIKGE